jgi:catechol 2,3-dioxygenase-like lactoylglutathione lyase family enzyme
VAVACQHVARRVVERHRDDGPIDQPELDGWSAHLRQSMADYRRSDNPIDARISSQLRMKRTKKEDLTMLGTCQVMTFVQTSDGQKARRFYEEVLGLKFNHEDDYALIFDLHAGVPLRIQKVADPSPALYTRLGWFVDDIEVTVRGLAERGVTFERYEGLPQDQLGIWSVPGAKAKVAWFKDPDGNTLSVTQA